MCTLSTASVRSTRRHCNSGVKDLVAVPPVGTRVSFFERSLLGPNSARLSPGPEGNNIYSLIPGQRSPMVFPGVERDGLSTDCISIRMYSAFLTVSMYSAFLSVRTLHLHFYPYVLCISFRFYVLCISIRTYSAFLSVSCIWAFCLYLCTRHTLSTTWVPPSRRHCNSGVKDLVAVPPIGTRVSFFERSLLGPNSARLSPGPEGNT